MTAQPLPIRGSSRPARIIIRAFIEKVLEGVEEEILVEELIQYARKRFARDEEFHAALLEEALGVMVADEFEAMLHRRRHESPEPDERMVRTASGAVRQEALVRRSLIFQDMFLALGEGRRKRFLKSNRLDLDVALEMNGRMISGLQRRNGFYLDVRRRLRSDQETVEERLSEAELERLWANHYRDSGKHQLRIAE